MASQASDRLSLHQRLQSETRQARLPHGHPLGDFPELPGPARDFPACVPAELAGPRLAVVPGSQPEALEAGPALPAGCRRDPQGLGSWGYSTCPQRPLVPSKSITTSPTLPGRPCPKASSLDSPGQQQCRPVHRWEPLFHPKNETNVASAVICLAHWIVEDWEARGVLRMYCSFFKPPCSS